MAFLWRNPSCWSFIWRLCSCRLIWVIWILFVPLIKIGGWFPSLNFMIEDTKTVFPLVYNVDYYRFQDGINKLNFQVNMWNIFFWSIGCMTLLFYRTLRPYPISSKRIVPPHIERPDWADDVSFNNSCCAFSLREC